MDHYLLSNAEATKPKAVISYWESRGKRMKNIVSTSMLVSLLSCSVTASATLIDRGHGMIYDSNQNLTWLQDTNYAKTSGYDDDGLMGWDDAMAWASNLTYGGYDDWRLPKLNIQKIWVPIFSSGPEIVGKPWGFMTSEINTVLTNPTCLPSVIYTDDLIWFSCSPWPPYFTSIGSNPFWYSVEEGVTAWAGQSFTSIIPTALHPKSDQLQAWAVREGDVAAIPEPHSVALVALGLACMGYSMRKTPRLQRNRD